MKPANVETSVFIAAIKKRTCLMFSKALQHAEDGNVLFISKNVMNELPKDLMYSGQITKDILRRITFVYPSNWNEVISKCSTIHTWRVIPHVIIVDGLENYFDLDPKTFSPKSALLCAALLDAAGICARMIKNKCLLNLSIDKRVYSDCKEKISSLLDMYFDDDITIEP